MLKHFLLFCSIVIFLCAPLSTLAEQSVTDKPVHGIPGLEELLKSIPEDATESDPFVLKIPHGIYHFYADQAVQEELYISNGLQINPKLMGVVFRHLKNVVIDFQDSELILHGKILPVVMENCENCTLKNFRIDSESPPLPQFEIIRNDDQGIVIVPFPWIKYEIRDDNLVFKADFWEGTPDSGMIYDKETKHVLHNISGISPNFTGAQEIGDRTILCPNWKDKRLVSNSVAVLRPFLYTQSSIFLYHNLNTKLENIKIHYGQAKGIIAQCCENIHLDKVSVCFRENVTDRYFTANADATHFSQCKGTIICENGLYESMMDDAINVHGVYLKITKKIDDHTIQVNFMQPGTWGLEWGQPGDEIRFNHSYTMDAYEGTNVIKTIKAVDKPTYFGAKTFEITLEKPLIKEATADGSCGVENLTWTPSVVFRNNIIRNNRARGGLFSTPKSVLIENNLYDYVSGAAILFCGDCNGWYESGACRKVVIRNNRFINCLGSLYQYCQAIISIFPEIPRFAEQRKYFYGGEEDSFVIENNEFETFDDSILYGRSVDGLVFRHNTIKKNHDFPQVSPHKIPFHFEMSDRIRIYDNHFEGEFPKEILKKSRTDSNRIRWNADEPFGSNERPAKKNTLFAYRSFNKELDMTAQFAKMGVSVRCFYASNTINSMGQYYCEYPLIWKGYNNYNWAALDQQIEDFLSVSPDEKFLCMVDLNTPYWLTRRFAFDSFSDITRAAATEEWFNVTLKWMTDFLNYTEAKYGDKIVGYILTAGGTSEWYEYDRGLSSRVKNEAWRKWNQKNGFECAPDVPIETELAVASHENRLYNPATELPKIHYWQFHNEIIVDAILRYAQAARLLIAPEREIGVFFGYFLVTDPKLLSFGHIDYERVYASPDIDFYISPAGYQNNRIMGAGGGPQLVLGSLNRYGKRYLHEIDHGTSLTQDWMNWASPAEDEAGLKRETAFALINHSSLWIFDMWGGRYATQEIRDVVRRCKEVSDQYIQDESPSIAEVLLIVDPQSAYYINEKTSFANIMSEKFHQNLAKTGAPYDVYSFNDIPFIDLSRYKAVFLPGTFFINQERADLLNQYLLKDNRSVVWMYAPGISDGKTLDKNRVKVWTGVDYGTQGLITTEQNGWKAVYAFDYSTMTTQTMRQILDEAGVHCYLDETVPVYANERLLAVHVKEGGTKEVRLPRLCKKVIDVYQNCVIAENVDSFSYEFKSPDTVLFELQ